MDLVEGKYPLGFISGDFGGKSLKKSRLWFASLNNSMMALRILSSQAYNFSPIDILPDRSATPSHSEKLCSGVSE
jgi:hypothetical protein